MHFNLKSIVSLIIAAPLALAYIDQPCTVPGKGEGVCVKSNECKLIGYQQGEVSPYTGYYNHWPCPEDPDDVICCYKKVTRLANGSTTSPGTCINIANCPVAQRDPSAQCPGSQNVQLCKQPVVNPGTFTTHNIIDISQFNDIYNYNSVANAADVDGVIMRVGGRYWGTTGTIYNDSAFETHYKNFKNKVKIGYYFYSQARNEDEAVSEANFVINKIKGKQNDFPIYWDSELGDETYRQGRADQLGKPLRTKIGLAFVKTIKNAGYRAGVYASESWFNYELDLNQFINAGCSIWVARYVNNLNDKPKISKYDAWQYCSDCSVNGMNGPVDKSFVYTNIANW